MSIGLVIDKVPTVGVVFNPILDEVSDVRSIVQSMVGGLGFREDFCLSDYFLLGSVSDVCLEISLACISLLKSQFLV